MATLEEQLGRLIRTLESQQRGGTPGTPTPTTTRQSSAEDEQGITAEYQKRIDLAQRGQAIIRNAGFI